MTAKMGYENQRFTKVYGNKPITAEVGGSVWHFRSTGEYQFAKYLEYLRCQELIRTWGYELRSYFFDEPDHPKAYLPDFSIVELDGSLVVVEFKTLATLTHAAVKKLKRMRAHYPDIILELVMDRIEPGIGAIYLL